MPQRPTMTQLSASPSLATVGQSLRDSPVIDASIRRIVDEVRAFSSRILDARPPNDALAETYQGYLSRAADTRGRSLLYPYIGSGIGNGALVELLDGSVKWDMISGIGVHFFGHSHPEMIEAALRAALDDVNKHGNLQSNHEAFHFAETILEQARKASRLNNAFLSTSGAMANESALKICHQKHNGAPRVLAFKDCFMGRSITMSQIGDSAANRVGVPLTTLVDYMPFYDPHAAERMGRARYIDMAVMQLQQYIDRYPGQHACFIFELVQGEGGFNTAPRDFFKPLMELCKASNIAVWDDEIQTFGRTDRMFAYESLDLGQYVDVLTVGKMTQACATLFTPDYMPKPGLLSGTFTGESVSFAIGTRVIEILRDGDHYGPDGVIARHHHAFTEQVRSLAAKHPEWFPLTANITEPAGGIGGMMRFTPFAGDKSRIWSLCEAAFQEGVILFYCGHGPYHIRMLPPLGVFDINDWPRVFAVVERAMARVAP